VYGWKGWHSSSGPDAVPQGSAGASIMSPTMELVLLDGAIAFNP
jgi:hypothetical protein